MFTQLIICLHSYNMFIELKYINTVKICLYLYVFLCLDKIIISIRYPPKLGSFEQMTSLRTVLATPHPIDSQLHGGLPDRLPTVRDHVAQLLFCGKTHVSLEKLKKK